MDDLMSPDENYNPSKVDKPHFKTNDNQASAISEEDDVDFNKMTPEEIIKHVRATGNADVGTNAPQSVQQPAPQL